MDRRTLLSAGVVTALAPRFCAAQARDRRTEIESAARRGMAFLRKNQGGEGAWQRYPGITALAVLGFLRHGVKAADPAVDRACRYLAAQTQPDGGLYTRAFGPAQALPNYNTALSLLALHTADPRRYAEQIRKAREFLARSQFDEGEGFRPTDPQYGGIGYGSRADNPDLSNLQNALEALREAGHPKNDDVFRKALIFLQRCQNRKESNDQRWAGTDGGFVYASSGESKADEHTGRPNSSYGSMTYAGLKSYLYCGVERSDPRVQAAWGWLRNNWTVEENPRMGDDGLYYHFHTMSKTLALWGERLVTDAQGRRHRWAEELSGSLLRRQRPDGSWVNKNPRWREDQPELVTGYALISLANCLKGI